MRLDLLTLALHARSIIFRLYEAIWQKYANLVNHCPTTSISLLFTLPAAGKHSKLQTLCTYSDNRVLWCTPPLVGSHLGSHCTTIYSMEKQQEGSQNFQPLTFTFCFSHVWHTSYLEAKRQMVKLALNAKKLLPRSRSMASGSSCQGFCVSLLLHGERFRFMGLNVPK